MIKHSLNNDINHLLIKLGQNRLPGFLRHPLLCWYIHGWTLLRRHRNNIQWFFHHVPVCSGLSRCRPWLNDLRTRSSWFLHVLSLVVRIELTPLGRINQYLYLSLQSTGKPRVISSPFCYDHQIISLFYIHLLRLGLRLIEGGWVLVFVEFVSYVDFGFYLFQIHIDFLRFFLLLFRHLFRWILAAVLACA